MSEVQVLKSIAAVAKKLSQAGIAKGRTNQQQGFKFRGIDEVLNAISPMLADEGLIMAPKVLSREVTERTTKSGGALFYVVLMVEYTIYSAVDGSSVSVVTCGEAMDSGDKATNKAMSAAYKYAAFQTFAIPTEGTPDADAETHEVAHGMDPSVLADWLQAIEQCDDDSFAAMVADGLAAAQEVRDREAWVAIRAAGKKREGATT